MSNARENVLRKLYASSKSGQSAAPNPVEVAPLEYTREERVERLKTLMEAIKTQVHICKSDNWTVKLQEILREKNLNSLMYSPEVEIGPELEKAWEADSSGLPELTLFDDSIDNIKDRIFDTDAAITTTVGAIADVGAMVVWPTPEEPRTMSLVPGVHIAVVKADEIYNSFPEIIEKQGWAGKMPTNSVLISGPSKTADIELILAFGVHGPKELIVLIVD